MDKKIIVFALIALLIVVLAAGGCFYWSYNSGKIANEQDHPNANGNGIVQDQTPQNPIETGQQQTSVEDTAQTVTDDIVNSVKSNPVENKPDINPADNVNPIRKVKTNPFD